jgi:hypothetical protein
MPRIAAAGLTIVLAVIVALAVQTGFLILVVATIVVAQFLIATAPAPAGARGRAIPTPQFAATVSAGLVSSGIAFHPVLLLGAPGTKSGADGAVSTGVFAGLLPAMAVGVVVAIVAQIARKDGRAQLVQSLAAVVALAMFAATASAWIGAARASGSVAARIAIGGEVVTVGCAGMAAGMVIWAIPMNRTVMLVGAPLAGGATGAGASVVMDTQLHWSYAACVGLGAAGFAILGVVLGRAWTQGRGHLSAGWGFPGALAFAVAGPLVYIGAQLATAAL